MEPLEEIIEPWEPRDARETFLFEFHRYNGYRFPVPMEADA